MPEVITISATFGVWLEHFCKNLFRSPVGVSRRSQSDSTSFFSSSIFWTSNDCSSWSWNKESEGLIPWDKNSR